MPLFRAPTRRRALPVVLAVLVSLVAGACSDTGAACPSTPESVAAYASRTWPEGAGGTLLTARGDEPPYCRGFGLADRGAHIAAGCDTVYDIMSITKQFTAAAILRLQSDGRLHVSDHLTRYFAHVPADKRDITLRQLLTHTSGLVEALGDDYAPLSRDAMVRKALASSLQATPGQEWHYSNTGYSLLAAVVEKVSGVDYEHYLARTFFTPAGMTRTGYVLPHWRRDRIAVEYDDRGRSKGRPNEHPWADDGPYWNLRGNGGLLSTARDMYRWHRALATGRALSASALRQFLAPRVSMPDSSDSYGYGWVVSDTGDGPVTWHDGGNGWSLATYARSDRDGILVYWVSNHAYRHGRWNMDDDAQTLTEGLLCRARDYPPHAG